MAASLGDAHPWPIYNARLRVVFPLLDADGDPVSPSSPDSEASQDQGTFADCTNEATEIATSSGVCYLDLTAAEMDTKCTAVRIQSTGAKTTVLVLYPRRFPVVRTGTAQAGAAGTITLDSGASDIDDYYNGMYINCTNDTPAGVAGQARRITDYVGSTKVATVESNWGTNPSASTTFEILLPGEVGGQPIYVNKNDFMPVDAFRPEWSISGATLTVKKPDDTTNAYTKTLATDAAANPVIGST